MAKRYVVNLTSEERPALEKLVNTGRASAKKHPGRSPRFSRARGKRARCGPGV